MTPTPDAITMLAVAMPMSALYFLALGVCVLHDRRVDRRRVAAGPAAARRHHGRRARRRGRHRVIHLGVVINPTAGKGRGTQAGRRVHELLRARGHKVEDLSAATLAQATDRARAAAVAGARRARRRRRRRDGAPRRQRRRGHRPAARHRRRGDRQRHRAHPRAARAVTSRRRSRRSSTGCWTDRVAWTPSASGRPCTRRTSGTSGCCPAGSTPRSTRARTR